MAAIPSEITWIVRLLEEFGVQDLQPVTLDCDNKSALQMAHNPVLHHCTKHISINCHFTREKFLEGPLELRDIPTSDQVADILTKIVPSHQQQHLLSKLGMTSITPSLRGDDKDTGYTKDVH